MNSFIRVTAKSAQEIFGKAQLSKDAKALLQDGIPPHEYLDALIMADLFVDAIRFLAHALPKREAVWWACLCGRNVLGPEASPEVTAALESAERWVRDPSEEHRRATMPAAEAAELGNPGGCAAAAAFWSGGSLAPPNAPVVPPGEHLTAVGVSGAVQLAVVLTEPQKANEKYRKFLTTGIDVAQGKQLWR